MLLYLSGNTSPDIAFTVNCCAQYMFCPKRSHEFVLKILVRYLKHTQDRCLVLDPNFNIFKVDVYPDADFSIMYGQNNPDYPSCAKIITGFIITFSDCPDLFISKFQTETALSKMEAETISPSLFCQYISIIFDITQFLKKGSWPSSRCSINKIVCSRG